MQHQTAIAVSNPILRASETANFFFAASPCPCGRQPITTRISQEMLAEIIGTTRPRVSQLMNKFRKLGYYNGKPGGPKLAAERRSA
jgi:CRP-like cAMP-binding protein